MPRSSQIYVIACLFITICTCETTVRASEPEGQEEIAKSALTIYVSDITKQLIFSEQDTFSLNAIEKLTVFLEKSGLPNQIIYLPWTRAIKLAQTERNTLIFQLIRTTEREGDYHWIYPIADSEPLFLYGSRKLHPKNLRTEIRRGIYSAACLSGSAQCDLLNEFGFPDEKILQTSAIGSDVLEKLLVRGRIDFIAAFPSVFHQNLTASGLDAGTYESFSMLDNFTDYLAARKGQLDDEILKTLLSVTAKSD